MFEVSLRWQDGAVQVLIYSAVIVAVLWVMSKIQVGESHQEKGSYLMPKCGVCNEHYGELLVKHGEVCEDDSKAPAQRYSPEKTINDIKREEEEGYE